MSIELGIWFMVMMFNTTSNNNSVMLWLSVLLVEETDKVYHIMVYRVHLTRVGFECTTNVVVGTDLHR